MTDDPEGCCRYTFAYEKPVGRERDISSTPIMCDGNPLPSFEGEPKRIASRG